MNYFSAALYMKHINDTLEHELKKRRDDGSIRALQLPVNLVDFCSNDYLGFARSTRVRARAAAIISSVGHLSGSTGSRSISGNTAFAEKLEGDLADIHNAEAALLFNSGYNANVGLFACVARRGDTIITDELIHASIIDGCRLSHAARYKFAHNDPDDLEKKLKLATGNVFVAVESVYSMDGDMAPLEAIAAVCEKYSAALIVDEAHATGVFGNDGRGIVNQAGLENRTFARIHTFGKAIGCHGAIVVGSRTLREYLVNFARAFIFTTALPFHALANIRAAYDELLEPQFSADNLHSFVAEFRKRFTPSPGAYLIDSESPIQCVVIGGNEKTRRVSQQLQSRGFDVRAILNPSVPAGKERLRISIHLHNTPEEIARLTMHLNELLA